LELRTVELQGMSGRLILNLETVVAVATLLTLLGRRRAGDGEAKAGFRIEATDALRMSAAATLALLVYWRAAHSYFLSDDFVLVNMARAFHASPAAGKYAVMFTHGGGDGFFRPLGYISLFWSWPWAGFDPTRWHAIGLTLHIVNVLLVYILAGAMGWSRTGAWLASMLFAVDGAHPEAVAWVAGRFDALAATFVLIALIAFVRLWERPSAISGAVAGLAMTLGILTKESAYAAPLMMLVFAASKPGSFSRRMRFVAPFIALAAFLFAYRWTVQGGIGGYVTAAGTPQIFELNVVSMAKALLLRLWAILFFPIDWAAGAPAWLVILASAYAAVWIAVAATSRAKHTALALGLALAAAIPPVQQLLIGADLEKARLLYLPSVGFCLLAAAALDRTATAFRARASLAMLAFSGAFLLHNLGVRETVAAKAKTVCAAVASCSNSEALRGLPGSIDGVYFFANGLPECARMDRDLHPGTPQHACSLTWDEKTRELRPAP
jgi:hypothetical protein